MNKIIWTHTHILMDSSKIKNRMLICETDKATNTMVEQNVSCLLCLTPFNTWKLPRKESYIISHPQLVARRDTGQKKYMIVHQ